ncbi:UNVERIFIED_CONTAM: hypothetical protein GTU68_038905 [Idotea baltica]|nr:hypothetical protein [Idotea baltica]
MASEILVRYDPYDETIESYADNTAIVSKVCTAVESDRDNRIWLGTKEGGLFLFGYADQARTVEELVIARDKKIQDGGEPKVEIAIVEPVGLPDSETITSTETKSNGKTPSATSGSSTNTTPSTNTSSSELINSENQVLASASASVSSSTAQVESTSGISIRTDGDEKSTRPVRNEDKNTASTSSKTVISESAPTSSKINILANIDSDIKCIGELASVSVNLEGGNPPYVITWSDGVSDQVKRDLPSGIHKINVRDKDGQSVSANVIINDVSQISINILSQVSPSALDRKDGQTKIKVSGGTAPYNISWDTGETGDKARRLEGGLHKLTITDSNNCEFLTEVKLKGARILPELRIETVKIGQKLEIKNIYYEADSIDLTDNSHEVLDEIYEFLKQNKEVKIEIGGHTNNLPPDEYCNTISSARAKSVAEYLYSKGIIENRITYIGYGKRNPIASNQTKEGRKRNQRVEIQIISIN